MERSMVVGVVAAAVFVSTLQGCTPRNARLDGDSEARALGREAGRGSLAEQLAGQRLGEDGPLRDVHFDYDRYELRTEDRTILQANALWLQDNPRAKVEIEGHCDERGTGDYNMALGGKRAYSVKSYLLALGISADRFSTISYGDELPVCREPSESCWARNRRARSVVIQ